MLKYICERCGVIGDPELGNQLPDDWCYAEGSDVCPDCCKSYRELDTELDFQRKRLIREWFKEIK